MGRILQPYSGHLDRRVIWTGGYYNTDVSIGNEIEAARRAEIAGMKFKVGGCSPEADARRFMEARKAAGIDFVLIADANQGYTPALDSGQEGRV